MREHLQRLEDSDLTQAIGAVIFEPGDKAWMPDDGSSFPSEIVVVRSGGPRRILVQGESGDYFESAFYVKAKLLTLLPPWIDEPHPLGEIQRVFRDFCEEEEIMELAVSELRALRRERRGEAL